MNNTFLILILLIFSACNNDVEEQAKDCSGHTNISVWYKENDAHYLFIDSYSDNCFNSYDLLSVAQTYIDSLSVQNNVKAIYFINNRENFSRVPDEQRWDAIRKTFVYSVWFIRRGNEKVPESISVWRDGLDFETILQ